MRVLDYTTDKAPDLPNDWYALLDIADEKDAEDESKLTSAWIRAAILYHPDAVTKARREGERFRQQAVMRYQDIARAYDVLIDPVTRESYRQEREWYYQHEGHTPELRRIAKQRRRMQETQTTTLDEHEIRHPVQLRNHYMTEAADACAQWYLVHGRDGHFNNWGPMDDSSWLAGAAFSRMSDGMKLVDGKAASVLGRLVEYWDRSQWSFEPADGPRTYVPTPMVPVSPTSPVVPYRPRTPAKAGAAKDQPKDVVATKIRRKAPPRVKVVERKVEPKAEVKVEGTAEETVEEKTEPEVEPKTEVSIMPKAEPKRQPTAAPASTNRTLPKSPTALYTPPSYSNRSVQPRARRRTYSVSVAPLDSLSTTRADKLRTLLDSFTAMEEDNTRPMERTLWHIIEDQPPVALQLNSIYRQWTALADTKRSEASEINLQFYTATIIGNWHAYLTRAPEDGGQQPPSPAQPLLPDWWVGKDCSERQAMLRRIWFYALRFARRPKLLMGKYTHLQSALDRDKLDRLAIVPNTLEPKVTAVVEVEEEEEMVVKAVAEPEPAVVEAEEVKDLVATDAEDTVIPVEDIPEIEQTVAADTTAPTPDTTTPRSGRKPAPPPLRATRSMLTKPAPASASHNVSKLRSFWNKLCCGVGDELDDPPPSRTLKGITATVVTVTVVTTATKDTATVVTAARDTGDAADKLKALADASADSAPPKTFTNQRAEWKHKSWAAKFKARRFRAPRTAAATFSFPPSWPVGSYCFSSADGPMLFRGINDGKGKPVTVTLAEPPEPVPVGLLNGGVDLRAWRVEPGTAEPDGMTASNAFYRWDNRVVAMHIALSDELYAMYHENAGGASGPEQVARGDSAAGTDASSSADGTTLDNAGEAASGGDSTNEPTSNEPPDHEPTNDDSSVSPLNQQAQTLGYLQDDRSQLNLADALPLRHPSNRCGGAATIVDDSDDDDPPVYDPERFPPKCPIRSRHRLYAMHKVVSCRPPPFISTVHEVPAAIREVPSVVISDVTVEVRRHGSTKVAVQQSTAASDKGKGRCATAEEALGDVAHESWEFDGYQYGAPDDPFWHSVPTDSDPAPVDRFAALQSPGAGPSMSRAERQAGRRHWSESEFADEENQDEDDDRTMALSIGRPSGPAFREDVDDEVRNVMLRPSLDEETLPDEEEGVNDLVPPVLIVPTCPSIDGDEEAAVTLEETAEATDSDILEDMATGATAETAASPSVPSAAEDTTPKAHPTAATTTTADAEVAVEASTTTAAATVSTSAAATTATPTPSDSASTTSKDTAGTPESTTSSLPVVSPSTGSVPSLEQHASSEHESAELVTPSSSARHSPEPKGTTKGNKSWASSSSKWIRDVQERLGRALTAA